MKWVLMNQVPSDLGIGEFATPRRHELRSASFSEHELGIDVSLGMCIHGPLQCPQCEQRFLQQTDITDSKNSWRFLASLRLFAANLFDCVCRMVPFLTVTFGFTVCHAHYCTLSRNQGHLVNISWPVQIHSPISFWKITLFPSQQKLLG